MYDCDLALGRIINTPICLHLSKRLPTCAQMEINKAILEENEASDEDDDREYDEEEDEEEEQAPMEEREAVVVGAAPAATRIRNLRTHGWTITCS